MARDEAYQIAEERIAAVLKEGGTELDLSELGLTEVPDSVAKLTNLASLYLWGNQITAIPDAISTLTNLTELSLFSNQITAIPDAISTLTNLTMLNLFNNQITAIPDTISTLTNLTGLYLSGNQITAIPDTISTLTNLTELNLSGNQITAIPDSISTLTNLTTLYLSGNQITAIPDTISTLTNLTSLSLSGNQITAIPDTISTLTNLTTLYLSGNQITAIPDTISTLINLTALYLDCNPLDPISQSAYLGGIEELFAYLKSLQNPQEVETLHEAKLVLIGEGDVGKTTLLKALTGKNPQAGEQTTHGISIDIQALSLPHPDKSDTQLTFNAWDFGGQEVYRVTHQFFFSKRSVYLLLWEPRRGVQQCQVEDWLKMLRLRVGEAARV
ncbi:MAG: leucine-rich repeat domain-containing protein, partial [Nodosilinea sp.]